MAQLIRIEILCDRMPGFGLTRAQWSARGGVEWNGGISGTVHDTLHWALTTAGQQSILHRCTGKGAFLGHATAWPVSLCGARAVRWQSMSAAGVLVLAASNWLLAQDEVSRKEIEHP
jgi:hypothetical protein